MKFLVGITSLLCFSTLNAQTTTNSPYSYFGLGEQVSSNTQFHSQMGGLANGVSNSAFLNTTNPASLTSLNLTTFEIGGNGGFTSYKQNDLTNNFSSFNLSQLSLGMNVGEKLGVAFGILPETNIGYEITQPKKDIVFPGTPADTVGVTNSAYGKGGVSTILLGGAYKINPNLSVGVNFKYYFGNLIATTEQLFDNNKYASSRKENKVQVKDLGIDLGAQYKLDLNEEENIIFGATYRLNQDLNTTNSIFKHTLKHNSTSESTLDTIPNNGEEVDGSLNLPSRIGIGFTYNKIDKLTLGADINFTNWKGFSKNGVVDDRFKNSTEIIIGGAYTPNKNDIRSFWKRTEYRAGIRYNTGNISPLVNNQSLTPDEFGINFGIGLPIRKTRGTLSIGIEYGKKGTLEDNLVKENYFKTSISLTFRDKWFVRRKID